MMRVLMLNGSPHARGCTHAALTEVAGALESAGISTEILHVGGDVVRGCVACGKCKDTKRCVFTADKVNVVLDKMDHADGLVIGSPVYYASPNGTLLALLDRVFYTGGGHMAHKPGAAVVSARRAGTTASLDVLQKYFIIEGMPLVPSQYWPMVHGSRAEDVLRDEEGLQIMRTLGRNMAWLLKCIQAGPDAPAPETEKKRTNFIR